MAFTSEQLARLTRDASSAPHRGQVDRGDVRLAYWAQRFAEADLAAVHLFSRSAQPKLSRLVAIAISKLGNGWIYPILLPIVFLRLGWSGWHVVLLAALNAALLHALYPLIKKRFGRKRPFQVDASLPSLLKTLDESSFPSGHAMTLTGVLAPIVLAWPAMTLGAVAMMCAMAWSRIATAHHYPSDVAAGVALGAGIAYPLSSWALLLF